MGFLSEGEKLSDEVHRAGRNVVRNGSMADGIHLILGIPFSRERIFQLIVVYSMDFYEKKRERDKSLYTEINYRYILD